MKKIILITAIICLFSFSALGEISEYSDAEIDEIERRIQERRDERDFKSKNRLPNLSDLELIDFSQ